MFGSTIEREVGYTEDGYTYYPVVIMGAGETGIALACRLREVLNCDQFRVFERQSGIGGTWWINRYPGVACDVPALFYSFSFCQNSEWTSLFPTGPEIIRYLQRVCEKYQILDKIQLNTDVTDCTWNETESVWDLTVQRLAVGAADLSSHERERKIETEGKAAVFHRTERIKAKVLCSAVGGLVLPRTWPDDTPGRGRFQGSVFHSARWDYSVDMTDKNVIVVGTGCSAAQFVPKLTKEYGAKSVTQIMRSPPWVVPRLKTPVSESWWSAWSPWLNRNIPGYQSALRLMIFCVLESDFTLFGNSKHSAQARAELEKKCVVHLKKTVPEKYYDMLTPDYSVCCKRRIFDNQWLPSLNDTNVELTTQPLTSVAEKSVTLGPGRTYPAASTTSTASVDERIIPADVIVLANGFEVVKWLHPIEITGKGGKKLQEVFEERGGPQLYMGTAMDGFPNFFALFGPNTATGHSSVILASENMAEHTLKLIRPILKGDVSEVEVKKEAEMQYTADVQRALKNTVYHTGGCASWYKTDNDWNSTTYPYTQIWFGIRCLFPTWRDWDMKYTTKGLRKVRLRKALRWLLCSVILIGTVQLRMKERKLQALQSIPTTLKTSCRRLLQFVAAFLQETSRRL